jgi:hypothetical protein
MATQRITNRFDGGMAQDAFATMQPNNVYYSSTNGRLIFNEALNSYAWENTNGTVNSFNLPSNYAPISGAEINGMLIIFSVSIVAVGGKYYSEIGFAKQDTYGQYFYTTAFNDYYDPNGDMLNFSQLHQIECRMDLETPDKINAYFIDNYNEDRVFNIMAGQPFNWAPAYPSWYSVHSMSEMMNVNHILPSYNKTTEGTGALVAGSYQYCYRLIHPNGYVTPYSPVTFPINLTSTPIDNSNWTNYQMTAAGTSTTKSIVVDFNGLDIRFNRIQVAAIYWEVPDAPQLAYIFADTTYTSSNIQITHSVNGGTEIALTDITQQFTTIRHTKTQEIYKANLHKWNVSLYEKLTLDTNAALVYPSLRNMMSDTTQNSASLPFTGQTPVTGDDFQPINYGIQGGGIRLGSAPITNEYVNYKGTQFANKFTGYFRGEVYPFAIVLYDMKGQPMFANHIADVQFPTQYATAGAGTTYTTNKKLSTVTQTSNYVDAWASIKAGNISIGTSGENTFKPTGDGATSVAVTQNINTSAGIIPLRTMGAMIDGIDLTDVIYDSNGKQQVSGFAIVRMPRYKNVAFQGIAQSVFQDNLGSDVTLYSGGSGTNKTVTLKAQNDNKKYIRTFDGAHNVSVGSEPSVFPNRSLLFSPDLAFGDGAGIVGGSNPNTSINPNYRLHIQGAAFGYNAYSGTGGLGGARITYFAPGAQTHYYSKCYQSERIGNAPTGAWTYYGNFSTGVGLKSNDYQTIYGQQINGSPPSSNGGQLLDVEILNGIFSTCDHQNIGIAEWAMCCSNSIYDWSVNSNGSGNDSFNPVYPIVNYEMGVVSPTITQTELDNRIYNNIGHFTPITQQLITDCTDHVGNIIVNGIEVFGGDCFLDYYNTCLEVPIDTNANDFNSARSVCFPCESEYNFSLRYGNIFDKVGTQQYQGTPSGFGQGYFISNTINIVEPFNIAASLQVQDNWDTFFPKISTVDYQYYYPVTDFFSQTKIIDETFDSYRKFLVNDFGSVEGSFGTVNKVEKLHDDLYYYQNSAFGRARFKERTLVATSNGQIDTGTGIGWAGYEYINLKTGLQHQWGFVSSSKAHYWVDAAQGKMCRFSQAGLDFPSDLYGMHNFFTNISRNYWLVPSTIYVGGVATYYNDYYNANYPNIDNPCRMGGICGVFDFKNNAVLFTFTPVKYAVHTIIGDQPRTYAAFNSPQTIEFNEKENKFQTFHSFIPKIYFNFKQNYLSAESETTNAIWTHDEGIKGKIYNRMYNSELIFNVKPEIEESKYFDNGRLQVQSGQSLLTQLIITSPQIAAQILNLTTDARVAYLEGIVRYPLVQLGQSQRFRDIYVQLDFQVTNDGNNTKIILPLHETLYRISPKTN